MKIGMIGASSQVGASVAYFLGREPGVEMVCFIRSARAEVYFELLGIACRRLDLSDPAALGRELAGLDAVVDFSHPAARVFEVAGAIREHVRRVVAAMRPGSTYIYMSSIMAYGMGPSESRLKRRVASRSFYSRAKRAGESATFGHARRARVIPYVFRLGQVHGTLQSVSAAMRADLAQGATIEVNGGLEEPTNTIFPSAVAAAVVDAAAGKHPSGTYALVSTPQWTLRELYRYYEALHGTPASLRLAQGVGPANAKRGLLEWAKGWRHLLEAYVLMSWPWLALRLKGLYRVAENRRSGEGEGASGPPRHVHLLGRASPVFPVRGSSPDEIRAAEHGFDSVLERRVREARA